VFNGHQGSLLAVKQLVHGVTTYIQLVPRLQQSGVIVHVVFVFGFVFSAVAVVAVFVVLFLQSYSPLSLALSSFMTGTHSLLS
jgi:hypothetical protein